MTADPQASGDRPRYGARGRRAVALIVLALGLAGFVISATGLATQLLPRQFTAAQQQQIKNWEIASRWQQLAAGQIFPASVRYQLSASVLQDATSLNLDARRIGIAPQSGCGAGITTAAAAAVLRREGCRAVLRATYVDATWSYVMTVGVAVLPSDAAAKKASQSLSQTAADRGAQRRDRPAGRRHPGGQVPRHRGGDVRLQPADLRRASPTGPYLVMYAAGYADSRPRVPMASDRYSDTEMTMLAQGVARSVADTLAAQPASPHCPGAPGC